MNKSHDRDWGLPMLHPADYETKHEDIAERLNSENYRDKSVVRWNGRTWLRIWIQESWGVDRASTEQYDVCATSPEPQEFDRTFKELEPALAYANGEDGSELARTTVPAERSQWPPEEEAPWTIMFGPGAALGKSASQSPTAVRPGG